MKHLKMIFNFYSQNKLSTLILFLITTFSVFVSSYAVGQYRFCTYTRDLFAQSGLNNSVYYMPTGFNSSNNVTMLPDEFRTKVTDSQKNIKEQFDCIKSFAISPYQSSWCYGNNKMIGGAYYVYCDETLKAFPLKIVEGKNLDSNSNSDPYSDKGIDAVICNYQMNHVPIGSVLPIMLYDRDGKPSIHLKIHVIGKMRDPSYAAMFGTESTEMNSTYLLSRGNGIYFRGSTKLLTFLQENDMLDIHSACFVNFKPDAKEDEKKKCMEYLKNSGNIATYEEIIKNSNDVVARTLKEKLPMPLFFLFISTISLISVSILFVFKKFHEHSIFYLCGCSRKRSFAYMAQGIGIISLAAGIVNAIIISNMDFIFEHFYRTLQIHQANEVIFDNYSILYILIYIAITLLLTVGIPYFVFRKLSPIEAYRRSEL